jgi:MscS family membrane protein
LGRENPRSSVTGFLEACHSDDYAKAAQYLDLSRIPVRSRAQQGPILAKDLEAILNSDSRFDVLRLSLQPQGNPTDQTNPTRERVATITQNGQTFPIDLEHLDQQPGSPWVFAPETVAEIPGLTPTTTESAIEARLPRFLVSIKILATPLWKWIALLIVAIIALSIFRLLERLLRFLFYKPEGLLKHRRRWVWVEAVLQPFVVFACVIVFRVVESIIAPSALARLFIGRGLLLVVVWSIAWCLINLVELFLSRVDSLLDPRQRQVSHSLLYLGRRVTKVVIVIFAIVFVLDNWGYPMNTIIAGLGVSGIAIALAAQSTIANVFGGVAVIGDRPVMVGDFGKFGDLIGTVEDIGMRSTRIRTLNRTIVSVPNNSFSALNLENYSLRDKILFNPTLQIKRATSNEQIRHCMTALSDMLTQNKSIEVGPSPVRLSALTAASYALEIFAYGLTSDIDQFYKLEADLFLAINDVIAASGVELV